MTAPRFLPAVSRRSFLAGASVLPAAAGIPGLARGDDGVLRVGVVGCGGRGTGAAIQAAAADPGVRIVALADLFADQVASCATVLERSVGGRADVPAVARHAGPDAWRALLAEPLDVVILAAAPASRPAHLAAAVAAGLHPWCEPPAAIEEAGLAAAADAVREADERGLVVGSGLCSRFDPRTAATVERVRAGEIGRVRSIALHDDANLPWRKPLPPGTPAAEVRQRNWISFASLSGGHFVERHVHALDRALWILGDDEPVAVEAVMPPEGPSPAAIGDVAAAVHVRYSFASGAVVEASCRRDERMTAGREETVVGSLGRADLVAGTVVSGAGVGPETATGTGGMHLAAMAAFLGAVRTSSREGTGAGRALLRATALALLGRRAAGGGSVAPIGRVTGAGRA